MTRNINNRIAVILAAAVTASCTIKEDRQSCPCWLDIDITGCAQHTREVHLSVWDTDRIFSETVTVADYPDTYGMTVRKAMVTTSAFCGLQESSVQHRRIIIPPGCQSDQIRAHAALVDCTGEAARDSASLCRQYATVFLSMEGGMGDGCDLEVVSDVCGIDYVSLTPVEGEFRYSPQADDNGVWMFRLPRQKTDSKPVVRVSQEDMDSYELPLHEWISRSGYSWLDEDLKDIYIGVDYSAGKVSLIIQGWEDGDSVDITI